MYGSCTSTRVWRGNWSWSGHCGRRVIDSGESSGTGKFGDGHYGLLVKDAGLFSGFFSKLLYSRKKGEDNKVAHNLARLASSFVNCVVWIEDVPPHIYSVVQVDMADSIICSVFSLKKKKKK